MKARNLKLDKNIISRFQKLISSGDELLNQAVQSDGYEVNPELKDSRWDVHDGQYQYIPPTKRVNVINASQWGISCLDLLKEVFCKNDFHYEEFNKHFRFFNTDQNYKEVSLSQSILKAAKDDYENNCSKEDTQEPKITKIDNKKIESLRNTCDEEAERNTKIYLIIIFEFLLLISSLFFYFFGIKYASIFTIIILIISYLISAFSLKEWTPTKLPERILEIEKDRIYKRFNINAG